MADKKAVKCAHPGCARLVAKGSKYCSPYCERAGKEFSIACNCGHRECSAGETASAAR